MRVNGAQICRAPPPMRLEVTYSVTAWTKAVAGRAPAALPGARDPLLARLAARRICSTGRLTRGEPVPLDRDRGRPAEGGEGRLLDLDRRPLQGVDRLRDPARGRVRPHLHARAGGADADGARSACKDAPRAHDRGAAALRRRRARRATARRIADAWVALPDLGRFASTDRDGPLHASTGSGPATTASRLGPRTGDEASGTANVPGGGVDLELGGGGTQARPGEDADDRWGTRSARTAAR